MTSRLLFIQPYMPAYRVPFFLGLRESLAPRGIMVDVAVSRVTSDREDARGGFPVVETRDPLSELTADRLRLRPSAVHRSRRYDLVVVEQAVRNLDSLPLLVGRHARGPGVAMWGHGATYSALGPVRQRVKTFLTRHAEWFFAYTQRGARVVVDEGFPPTRVTVIGNTIDTAQLADDLASISDQPLAIFRTRHDLTEGATALFLGGVDRMKDIGFLLEVARAARTMRLGVTILVAGAGEGLPAVRIAQASGLPVRALGRVDGGDKALALRASVALVIPSGVGLVAVDALVAGRPIITRDNSTHGPEAEYLTPGGDSIWLPAGVTPPDFARSLADLLADPRRLQSMQESCRRAAALHTLDSMVQNVAEGILEWREVHSFGLGRA